MEYRLFSDNSLRNEPIQMNYTIRTTEKYGFKHAMGKFLNSILYCGLIYKL
jgi:hypothetical protein